MKNQLNAFILTITVIIGINTNAFAQKTGVFTDARDGKTYKTVKIGDQVWMAENLAYKADSACWAYDNDTINVNKYGYLYSWETAKKVCPNGWHLPTENDFETLITNIDGDDYDAYPELMPNGSSGFNAFMGGWSYSSTGFNDIGKSASFWSSSAKDDQSAWNLSVGGSYMKSATVGNSTKSIANSVRCIKDN